MANWLRNVQNQLQELASEVLNEATQEVEDPESELQVERKKCVEAERTSLQAQAKSDELQRRVAELEDQLYSTNVENDAIKEKFEGMIRARDEKIKQYQTELERLQQWGDDDSDASDNENGWSGNRPARQHSRPSDSGQADHLREELQRLKQSHAEELTRLNEEHRVRVQELRSTNERLVAELQNQHQSQVEDAHQKLLQAETECAAMAETNEKLREEMDRLRERVRLYEQEVSEKSVRLAEIEASLHAATVNGNGTLHEKEQETLRLLSEKDNTIEHLKAVNNELMVAYNELNEELEKRKADHGTAVTTHADLIARIDSLKANLVEYEERYELCKQEHAETVRQLEKLTTDFEQLRTNLHVSRTATDSNEELLNQEVQLLRDALQQAKSDRDQLRSDVHSFRESVSSIDNELSVLRERNQRLSQENAELTESLHRYESVRDSLQESNGELASIRTRLGVVQEDHRHQVEQLTAEKNELIENTRKLETELEAQRTKAADLDVYVAELNRNVGQKESQIAELKAQLDNAEEQDKLKHRIDELENRLAEQQQEILRYRAMPDTTAGVMTTEETSQTEPSERSRNRLPSEAGTDSAGSNNGWGNDWVVAETPEVSICSSGGSANVAPGGPAATTASSAEDVSPPRTSPTTSASSSTHDAHAGGQKSDSEHVEELQRRIDAFQQELEEARNQLVHLNEQHSLVLQAREGLTSRKDDLEQRVAQLEEDNARLEEAAATLKEQTALLSQVEETLANLKLAATASRGETDQLAQENETLRQKIQELQQSVTRWKSRYEEETSELNERDREIVQQFAELQQMYDERVASQEKVADAYEERIRELEAKALSSDTELSSRQNQLETLTSLNRQLQENTSDLQRSLADAEDDRAQLQSRVETLQREIDATAKQSDVQAQLEEITAQKIEAEHRADEMTRLVQEKHAESVQYYEKITELAAANQQLTTQAEQIQAQLAASNQQLAMAYEEKDRLNKELGRLRQHLLQMEEISTKEAIAAEERETELRKEIQMLRQQARAADENVVFSESSFQQEIGTLREDVGRLNEKCAALSATLSTKERQLADTSKALSNLQVVLRDIGKDHEAEMARRDVDVKKLRAEIQELTEQIEELQSRETQLTEDRRYHEDSAALLREELSQKCRVIDELEIQLEEAHRTAAHGSDSLESHTSTARDPSSYKIDDATLRQLFLSYLTAPRDKQPEIAMVMSSILGYGPEEQKRIQSSLSESDKGWFGFMRLGGRSPVPSGQNASLTEQFIRFLEAESLAATKPPTLPITSQATTIDLNEAPPPTPRSSDYSTSSDLRSILEEQSISSSS